MNHLAHLFLSGEPGELMLGNLLGDFVKGQLRDQYAPGIMEGLHLHRSIDAFTDAHPVFQQSRTRISPPRRRYSGVIIDICYDHFLARNWHEFCDEPLRAWSARVTTFLLDHLELYPPRLKSYVEALPEHRILEAYGRRDGIRATFEQMAERVTRENPLAGAGEELDMRYRELETDFLDFFPELALFTREWRAERKR